MDGLDRDPELKYFHAEVCEVFRLYKLDAADAEQNRHWFDMHCGFPPRTLARFRYAPDAAAVRALAARVPWRDARPVLRDMIAGRRRALARA